MGGIADQGHTAGIDSTNHLGHGNDKIENQGKKKPRTAGVFHVDVVVCFRMALYRMRMLQLFLVGQNGIVFARRIPALSHLKSRYSLFAPFSAFCSDHFPLQNLSFLILSQQMKKFSPF